MIVLEEINTYRFAGLLLAAGSSKRMGFPKQLLPINGEYLISHILKIMQSSMLEHIFVVLGAHEEIIRNILKNDNTTLVSNPTWKSGKGSSLRVGLSEIENYFYDAVVICVVDQVNLTTEIIDSLIHKFNDTKKDVIATRVNGVQCNPVLFSKHMFPAFQNLTGDDGGQKLIHTSRSIDFVDWENPELLLDLDTYADYQSLSSSRNPLR